MREKAWLQEVNFGSKNYPVIAIPILFLVFDAGKGNVTSLSSLDTSGVFRAQCPNDNKTTRLDACVVIQFMPHIIMAATVR